MLGRLGSHLSAPLQNTGPMHSPATRAWRAPRSRRARIEVFLLVELAAQLGGVAAPVFQDPFAQIRHEVLDVTRVLFPVAEQFVRGDGAQVLPNGL
jgi:hypothetical protein